ncbi:Nif3-like dinuclear metal center hexameric protein [Kaistella jeonii]|uniref:GTP cyclohydrolase 1 type 2 homolog n=1 Tax=Kaistella jeonii TaxID=266749 RepID=A0A0C1FBA0_9FLAO|nr:Nif3-like dinuclear metal center hexameric protein [Kaistella jeonii]KIA90402.1 NGG1p interacting factor 3 protein, NIF3 [Kaistella jeonii]SFB73426.1 dinuclear metal center protein, YbgI/SA1388 family [Kaistella jeonii]VEI95045.1 metal-binding protein [Kaistella jeonii]
MTINKAIFEIEKRIPLKQAEDFDNIGLLCGNPDRELTGILICHDALENVVNEAIEKNSNLIITFHPIIFSGLKSLTGKNYVERSVLKAIENKIAIYAIHTAFDNHYFGVNYGICEKLGLKNQQILMPKSNNLKSLEVYVPTEHSEKVKEALFAAGAGNIGFYDECSFTVSGNGTFRPNEGSNPFSGQQDIRENADEQMISVIFESYKQNQILAAMKASHPYEEVAYKILSLENDNQYAGLGRFGNLENEMTENDFLKLVKDKFNLKIIRHSNFNRKNIKRVGVLGGSGASGIKAAFSKNCDAYLTGDVKYHDFFQNEDKMMICDIGHFESEQFVTQQLFEVLSEIFPKFAISKSLEKTNPVNYFL